MFKTVNQKVSIVLLVIAIVYLLLAYQLPSYPYTNVDADVIPKGLGWLQVILSILLFISRDSETEEQKDSRKIPKKEIGILIAVGGFILAYILLLEVIGFVVVTALFIFFCTWFLGYKKFLTN